MSKKENNKETKMVIVLRVDLKNKKGEKIRTGKFVSQGAHSAESFLTKQRQGKKICFELSDEQINWLDTGRTKIALKVNSEKELIEIFQEAKKQGLTAEMITDAGRTEFDGPTKTCVSIGPNYSEDIDKITGHLSTL